MQLSQRNAVDRHTKPMIHKGAWGRYFCPDKKKSSLNRRKRENSSFTRMEKHQRYNSKLQRNKDG